ncbi:MAG TPA: hypothetical protein H9902_04360 [Candidatus Stackebrandtia faecavium]|nr:hypothetical protein [Candidatus Stackebrandtia faecavium]
MSNEPSPETANISPSATPGGADDGDATPTPRRGGRAATVVAAGAAAIVVTVGVVFGVKFLGGDGAVAGQSDDTDQAATETSDEIKQFDFKNVTVDNSFGVKQTLEDGRYTLPGYDEELGVGTTMAEGPVFADADEDGDLDAAAIYQWTPAAGTPIRIAFIWEWTGTTAKQVVQPVTAGYEGTVSDLAASGNEFVLSMKSFGPPPDNESEGGRVSFAMHDGYVVQVRPNFGAVDPCVVFDADQKIGTVGSDAPVYVTADAQSPRIRPGDEPFAEIVAIDKELAPKDWNLARLTSADGSIRCGWVEAGEVN